MKRRICKKNMRNEIEDEKLKERIVKKEIEKLK